MLSLNIRRIVFCTSTQVFFVLLLWITIVVYSRIRTEKIFYIVTKIIIIYRKDSLFGWCSVISVETDFGHKHFAFPRRVRYSTIRWSSFCHRFFGHFFVESLWWCWAKILISHRPLLPRKKKTNRFIWYKRLCTRKFLFFTHHLLNIHLLCFWYIVTVLNY